MTLAPETPIPVAATEDGAVDGFDSVDPSNGQVLASCPAHSAHDVERAVAQAREAASWWQAQGRDGRRRHLRAWRGVLARGHHGAALSPADAAAELQAPPAAHDQLAKAIGLVHGRG